MNSLRVTRLASFLRDFVRYVSGSPLSEAHQRAAFAALEEWRLNDLGFERRAGQIHRCQDNPMTQTAILERHTSALLRGASMLRDAREDDMAAIQRIYAHHVRHGLASFEEEAPDLDEMLRRREAVLKAGLPYLVATDPAGQPLGYSYATHYRPRSAYRFSIENSVYVAPDLAGRGLGRLLLDGLIQRCEAGPWRQMIAIIGNGDANPASVALHRACGFRLVGTLEAVGLKQGGWRDTMLMQRALGAGASALP